MKKLDNEDIANISLMTVIAVLLIAVVLFFVGVIFGNGEKDPERFVYNKHDYLYFKDRGVVHDPDCRHCFIVFD